MKDAVAAYLALRRAAGFEMANAEYLLESFARFANERNETHLHTQTVIDWAARGPSAARRDERLKAICRFARHVRVEDDRHELPPANYFGMRQDAPHAVHLFVQRNRPPPGGRRSNSVLVAR